ncbi:MAG: IPT/TIG domain-containing protein, partial [Acidobacteria bacterium]|nr:IPT/TIG domain-containing protein [Acidobacteriota bacterium]
LVILRDNPLEDIRNSRKIERVFIGGNEIDRGFHADYQVPIPRPTLPIVGTIDSIQPVRAPRASQSVSLVLRGQGFGKSSYVTFGGSPLRTTFESAQALRAVIPGELLSRVGTFAIEVVNPIPEGGTSTKAYFLVTYE